MDIRKFLDTLLPRLCLLCQQAAASHNLCAACFADLARNETSCQLCARSLSERIERCGNCQRAPPLFDRLCAPYRYALPLSQLLKGYKFRKQITVLPLLGQLVLPSVASLEARPDLVVPIPLHWTRLLHRGFNQAEQLAREICRCTGLRLETRALRRCRRTKPQSRLDHELRQANVAQVFAAQRRVCHGKKVLLVDDIATTGATAESACKALRAAGASRIDVLVVARA